MTDLENTKNTVVSLEQLTFVVVTYQSMSVIPSFFKGLQRVLAGRVCRIIVCDNASDDGIVEYIQACQWSNVEILQSKSNEGFGAGLNRGILAANTDYVVLLNPDVAIQESTLEKLLQFLQQTPDVAAVSSRILGAKNFSETELSKVSKPLLYIRLHKIYENIWSRMMLYGGLQTKFPKYSLFVPWTELVAHGCVQVSRFHGCFGMFRRADLMSIGMFDPRFFLFFEEDDIGYRLQKIKKKLFVHCDTGVYHLSGQGSAESRSKQTDKILLNSQYMFFRKHFGLFYAWAGFIMIWLTISMVLFYQICSSGDKVKQYKMLWHWHWQCFWQKGRVPEGTIPDESKHQQNYDWKDI